MYLVEFVAVSALISELVGHGGSRSTYRSSTELETVTDSLLSYCQLLALREVQAVSGVHTIFSELVHLSRVRGSSNELEELQGIKDSYRNERHLEQLNRLRKTWSELVELVFICGSYCS